MIWFVCWIYLIYVHKDGWANRWMDRWMDEQQAVCWSGGRVAWLSRAGGDSIASSSSSKFYFQQNTTIKQ